MKKIADLVLILLILTMLTSATPRAKRRLTEAGAIQKAEAFIIQQGYTDLPPTTDKSRLVPESVHPGTDMEGMKRRRNSLERNAYGVIKESGKRGGWIVVFLYNKPRNAELDRAVSEFNQPHPEKRGRAVSMDVYGRHLRVEHQNVNLDFAELKRITR